MSPYSAETYVQTARVEILADDYARAEVLLQKALHLNRPLLLFTTISGRYLFTRNSMIPLPKIGSCI